MTLGYSLVFETIGEAPALDIHYSRYTEPLYQVPGTSYLVNYIG